jgi:uncharacterized protein
MSGFHFNLATLPQGTSRLEVEATPAGIGLPEADWPSDILAGVALDRAGEQVTVRGDIRATARLECVRCLKVFDLPVETELVVYADRSGTSRHIVEEDDLERDDHMKFHDGRTLDVSEEVREALLLELPMAPRCREDCRGLCPRCGADLNEGPCGCEAER